MSTSSHFEVACFEKSFLQMNSHTPLVQISFCLVICILQTRGEMSNLTHVSSRSFSALAGALYASAILLYDPRLESVVKALPWILSGACCAILDFFVSFYVQHLQAYIIPVSFQSFNYLNFQILLLSCYRICYKCQSAGTLDSDTESLLGRFHSVTSGLYHSPKDKNARKHISSWKSSSKMPEMEPYRNTKVQPIRTVCIFLDCDDDDDEICALLLSCCLVQFLYLNDHRHIIEQDGQWKCFWKIL